MPRLEMRTGKHAGKTFDLTKAVILGRGDTVGIRVPDIKASREHCRVFQQGGKWLVVDLNSRNGITVNGAKTTRKELISGDEIAIGETVLAYVDEAAAAKPVTMTPEPEPGEIVVDEIDLGDEPAAAPAARAKPAKEAARSSKKDAAFAAARADSAKRAKKPAARGGAEKKGMSLNAGDRVLQFNKVDANKMSAFSMDLSQYPVVVQILIVGAGLATVGVVIWLVFKALGVTAG
jgi:hypothetical protein